MFSHLRESVNEEYGVCLEEGHTGAVTQVHEVALSSVELRAYV